ncbi:MAG TPA: nucleotidyltransferase family protein [Pyrinomonadaceae bacterium]|nr:nucleotidyltransferase family protein [Pyrinomonadaceae bacterium]
MTQEIPQETREKIAELCRNHRVRELSLFGSRSRGDHTSQSDYDFLVAFLPDARIGLIEFSGMQIELEELMMTRVDLVTKDGLRPSIRNNVLSEAQVIYEA